jgi:glucokinase
MKEVASGIDIGGTNTVIGFVDRSGRVIERASLPTAREGEPLEFVRQVAGQISRISDSLKNEYHICGIGIGAPNGNIHKGTIEFAPNLCWKGVVPLVNLFKSFFPLPVILTNDANAAALGEMIYGGAQNMTDFIMITLGTGVGSGLVVNGQVVYGHDGFAGELGHVIIREEGRVCGCGRKGCLEAYCSAGGILKTAIELLAENHHKSILSEIPAEKLNSKKIAEAASSGDLVAIKTFNITGDLLGKALANTIAHTSPEAIFLFGGPSQAGELIFKPTREAIENNVLKIYKGKVKVLPSQLPPGDAAVVGASALIWDFIEKETQKEALHHCS